MENQTTLVPCLCDATIIGKIDGEETYEVQITSSPADVTHDVKQATLIFQPGQDNNYKAGDTVKVLAMFNFGGIFNSFIDINDQSAIHIMGMYQENSEANVKAQHPISYSNGERVAYKHPRSDAGLITTSNGKSIITTDGSIWSLWDPLGYGINENLHKTMAQNHQRIISHTHGYFPTKEYFGMFGGKDDDDRKTRFTDKDFLVNYRRFVTQNKSVANWVSTCEGAYTPWVGPNNNYWDVKQSKEVLFSKVINHGDTRVSFEVGQPGKEFINLRLDKVLLSESYVAAGSGATPVTVGNKFKLTVSDDGSFVIRAGGSGDAPLINRNKFHMEVDKDGKLTIHATGGIELSTGDADVSINSLSITDKGIDVKASSGFRVNGKHLINENFFSWFTDNQPFITPGVSGVTNPAALAILKVKQALPDETSGFITKNFGLPTVKQITDFDDVFMST